MGWRVNWYKADKNEPLIITHEVGKYGDLCEIRARFFLVATRQNGTWYDIEGKPLSDAYIRTYLEN
jgi:hypothetical protein